MNAFTLYTEKENSIFYSNAVILTKILFPFLGIAILAALAMGVLHQRSYFFISASASSALNLGYILGSLVLAEIFAKNFTGLIGDPLIDLRVVGLAVGVLLGGLGHFLFQAYFVFKELYRGTGPLRFSLFSNKDLWRVFKLMAPAALASSAGSVNLLINTNFATSLGEGRVSWLNYAFRLFQLPVGIFGVALGAVALPAITKALTQSKGSMAGPPSQRLQEGVELGLWLLTPSFIVLYAGAADLISLIFRQGAFTATDSQQTVLALQGYSFGVFAYGLIKILTAAYYSLSV